MTLIGTFHRDDGTTIAELTRQHNTLFMVGPSFCLPLPRSLAISLGRALIEEGKKLPLTEPPATPNIQVLPAGSVPGPKN